MSGRDAPLVGRTAVLDLRTVTCRCAVVMEVCVVLADERPADQQTGPALEGDLALLSSLYRVLVEEVNATGGVVVGFRGGGLNILCAWNTDVNRDGLAIDEENARAGEAVLSAIRVSWTAP